MSLAGVQTDFEAETAALLDRHGAALLGLAAASIQYGLSHGSSLTVDLTDSPPELQRNGACFVTLKKNGQLRGCIGSPQARRSLIEDVAQNAFAAAFDDPRFPDLRSDEVADLQLSIAVLSPAVEMIVRDEADLLAQLRPAIDGLIIDDGQHRALFLPAVWAQLPEPHDFLNRLKLKAGLKSDHWSSSIRVQRFIACEARQSELPDPNAIWANAAA